MINLFLHPHMYSVLKKQNVRLGKLFFYEIKDNYLSRSAYFGTLEIDFVKFVKLHHAVLKKQI